MIDEQDLIIQLFCESDLSHGEIGEKFGMSAHQVSGITRKYGPTRGEWHQFRLNLLNERLQRYEERNSTDRPLEISKYREYEEYRLARQFRDFGMDYKRMEHMVNLNQRQVTIQIKRYLPSETDKINFYRKTVRRKYSSGD